MKQVAEERQAKLAASLSSAEARVLVLEQQLAESQAALVCVLLTLSLQDGQRLSDTKKCLFALLFALPTNTDPWMCFELGIHVVHRMTRASRLRQQVARWKNCRSLR
jgi:hypothetical protein